MRFLHTMIRVTDPDSTIRFFNLLGLEERRRMDSEAGRFTLIFLGAPGDEGGEVAFHERFRFFLSSPRVIMCASRSL